MIFWDTSALVRCYATGERGYERARSLLLGDQNPFASALIRPEAASAVLRRLRPDKRRAAAVLRVLEESLGHFTLIPLDDAQLDFAVRLVRKYALRGADAIHLAGALSMAPKLGRRRQLRFDDRGPRAGRCRARRGTPHHRARLIRLLRAAPHGPLRAA